MPDPTETPADSFADVTAETCPDHDLIMPHDSRYDGWRSCPPDTAGQTGAFASLAEAAGLVRPQ